MDAQQSLYWKKIYEKEERFYEDAERLNAEEAQAGLLASTSKFSLPRALQSMRSAPSGASARSTSTGAGDADIGSKTDRPRSRASRASAAGATATKTDGAGDAARAAAPASSTARPPSERSQRSRITVPRAELERLQRENEELRAQAARYMLPAPGADERPALHPILQKHKDTPLPHASPRADGRFPHNSTLMKEFYQTSGVGPLLRPDTRASDTKHTSPS